MLDVYEKCPKYENEKYLVRFVLDDDCIDLLKVYSDKKSVLLFNSDNCGGDDFYYTTLKQMKDAINYWHFEYSRRGFVRWSIIDKKKGIVVGTIELFNRKADDYFTECGLLRLDLRSDYEEEQEIKSILNLILEPAFSMFQCNKVATKAIPEAVNRITALKELGFSCSDEKLIGHDGTEYNSYFIIEQ